MAVDHALIGTLIGVAAGLVLFVLALVVLVCPRRQEGTRVQIDANNLPGVKEPKTYTVKNGKLNAIVPAIGMASGQISSSFGIWAWSQGTAYWVFGVFGMTAYFMVKMCLSNAMWFPVYIRREQDRFVFQALSGATADVPLNRLVSVGVVEVKNCFSRAWSCIEFTLTDAACKTTYTYRVTLEDPEQAHFLLDHGLGQFDSKATANQQELPLV